MDHDCEPSGNMVASAHIRPTPPGRRSTDVASPTNLMSVPAGNIAPTGSVVAPFMPKRAAAAGKGTPLGQIIAAMFAAPSNCGAAPRRLSRGRVELAPMHKQTHKTAEPAPHP